MSWFQARPVLEPIWRNLDSFAEFRQNHRVDQLQRILMRRETSGSSNLRRCTKEMPAARATTRPRAGGRVSCCTRCFCWYTHISSLRKQIEDAHLRTLQREAYGKHGTESSNLQPMNSDECQSCSIRDKLAENQHAPLIQPVLLCWCWSIYQLIILLIREF